MAKKIFTKKLECVNVQHNKMRSAVVLAEGVGENDKGPTARNVVNLSFGDPKDLAAFIPGKFYTIEISE